MEPRWTTRESFTGFHLRSSPQAHHLAGLARADRDSECTTPGRLAAVYAGHLHLDEEMELLAKGGLTYMWHGVNVLPGLHTKVHVRKVNGRHRSELLYSAGPY